MSIKDDLNKYTPRKEQKSAHDFIFNVIKENPKKKFFLLNLPTGIGKSHLAMMISNTYMTKINTNSKVDIITAGKILQDQYSESYESIYNLKGKENYECSQYDCTCGQGMEFNKLNKTECEFCPYTKARSGYLSGDISLTNFHLYLIYSVYNPKLIEQRKSNILIVDECLHPSSEITMFDNSKKRIDSIEIGDLVKTINEETNEIEIKPVINIHYNLNKKYQMYEIEMENGDVIKITGNHKVKLISGDWKKVEELKEEDEILYINESIESHEFDN